MIWFFFRFSFFCLCVCRSNQILLSDSTLQRPFKNLPPTGKAIPPPKISDSLYQSKAALMKQQASNTNASANSTNGTATAAQQLNAQQSQNAPPSSPPLPPPPEQTQNLPAPSDYAVTEL